MEKSTTLMRRAASTLTKMKNSIIDEPTAKKLSKLIYKDDIDIYHQEEVVEIVSEFVVNQELIRKLQSGEIRMESLTQPSLGGSIDGIALPKLPPIKTLEGQIGNCSIPFEKQLTKTDLDEKEGRLFLPKMAVEDFLKPMLKRGEEFLISGIDVRVYDENGRDFRMSFKFWSDKYYVLTKGWNEYLSENDLKECEDFVTIWMFRRNNMDELCFAVIRRKFPISQLLAKPRKMGNKKKIK